jgi:hypothetical protein
MSAYPILRAALILFFVIGFLYGLHFAPHINYYYFVEPYLKLKFTMHYTPVIDNRILVNPTDNKKLAEGLISCLNKTGDYIIFGSTGVDIASSPSALRLAFSDVDVDMIVSHLKNADGVLVDVPDVLGYRLPSSLVGKIVNVSRSIGHGANVTFKLLVVRSRSVFERGRVAVLIGPKYLDLVPRIMPITFAVGAKDTSSLEECIDDVFNYFRRKYAGVWPPVRLELYKVSWEQAYKQDVNNIYSEQMLRTLELFSVLAIVVAFIVGLREGIAYAESSSELIGVLRLYGAPRTLVFLLGFVSGLLVLVGVVAGMFVVPYLYYKGLFGGSMPPLSFLLSRTWSFFVVVLPACPLASGLGSLWYAGRRSLESFVSSG